MTMIDDYMILQAELVAHVDGYIANIRAGVAEPKVIYKAGVTESARRWTEANNLFEYGSYEAFHPFEAPFTAVRMLGDNDIGLVSIAYFIIVSRN